MTNGWRMAPPLPSDVAQLVASYIGGRLNISVNEQAAYDIWDRFFLTLSERGYLDKPQRQTSP